MIVVKQFGLQRSGTNLLKGLLEVNFDDVRAYGLVLGDKHGPADWESIQAWRFTPELRDKLDLSDDEAAEILRRAAQRDLRFTFTTKNPVAWLLSYWRYQRGKNPALPVEPSWEVCEAYLRTWRSRVAQWLQFHRLAAERSVFVRYEDLLRDPAGCLETIETRFRLRRAHADLVTAFSAPTKRGTDADYGDSVLIPGRAFDPSYYAERRYLADYPELLLRRVDSYVERMVAEQPELEACARLD